MPSVCGSTSSIAKGSRPRPRALARGPGGSPEHALNALASLLRPSYDALYEHVLTPKVIGVDWLMTKAVLRQTSLGGAVRYALAQWPRLTRFVEVPELWLDNNRTERGIRGPVFGRRNHFGSKSRRGTEAAAILYSLVETAKFRGVDPAQYLVDAASAARRRAACCSLVARAAVTLRTH